MTEPASRPWYFSTLAPFLLFGLGVGFLLFDGLEPYRVWWKRRSWKQVPAKLLTFTVPVSGVRVSRRGTQRYTYGRAAPQTSVFAKKVTEGWLLKSSKVVWSVRLSYRFTWKRQAYTKVHDRPNFYLETKQEAQSFLREIVSNPKTGALKVWVNPKDPNESTAFLRAGGTTWIKVGIGTLILSLLWLFGALILREKEQKAPKQPPEVSAPL